MTKRKALKVTIITGLVALVALAAGVGVSGARAKGEIPEYLGSKACLGCHVDKFVDWDETGHAHMLTQVIRKSDLPGDVDKAPEELKAELEKAAWIVAGQRFLARDPETGALGYLNVSWNAQDQQYVAYKGGSNWETGCAGCHSTGWEKEVAAFVEPGIGCEACHGPGRDHVLGKGEIAKITTTADAQACGQCHTGGAMPDGGRWPEGYKPGDDLHATGFLFPQVPDPHKGIYPDPAKVKQRQYPQWEQSAHAKATAPVIRNEQGQPDPKGKPYRDSCFVCHSGEGFIASLKGEAYSATENHPNNSGITCAACHDPHKNTEPGQLRLPADQLCITCHTASLTPAGLTPGARVGHQPQKEIVAGYGAAGVEPTKGAHSDVTCVECHMVEGNHLMRIVKPGEVVGTARPDSCTTCHSDSSRESRETYIDMWQEAISSRITKADADIVVIDAAVKAKPQVMTDDLKLTYETAKGNLSLVKGDQSNGAHNFEYTIKVMTRVVAQLGEVRAAVGK